MNQSDSLNTALTYADSLDPLFRAITTPKKRARCCKCDLTLGFDDNGREAICADCLEASEKD